MMYDWSPLLLSLELALFTTFFLVLIGVPLAYSLARSKSRFKFLVEAFVSLPLVLPPTVLGFYILVVFSPNSLVGSFLEENFGYQLAFSFSGLVFASILYSLPFMVQPIQSGLQNLSPSLSEAAFTMGKNKWQVLLHVLIPNIKPAILTGIVLSFAHTLGEFGVVLMIGGKIANETLVASIAVYDKVEALEYGQANFYSLVLLMSSFFILSVTYFINKKI
ncbi:MAG: molybdate ABC transporter permease subunit [Saprospiraceae bacterium]|nr:molybdate ABC transporter permease subunit [Saprospiraceae bacterium]